MGGWGWLETDNRAISVQLNLTGTATGTELGNIYLTRNCVGLESYTFLMSESGLLMIKPMQFLDISSI